MSEHENAAITKTYFLKLEGVVSVNLAQNGITSHLEKSHLKWSPDLLIF